MNIFILLILFDLIFGQSANETQFFSCEFVHDPFRYYIHDSCIISFKVSNIFNFAIGFVPENRALFDKNIIIKDITINFLEIYFGFIKGFDLEHHSDNFLNNYNNTIISYIIDFSYFDFYKNEKISNKNCYQTYGFLRNFKSNQQLLVTLNDNVIYSKDAYCGNLFSEAIISMLVFAKQTVSVISLNYFHSLNN